MPIGMSRFQPQGPIENPGLEFDRFLPDWQEDATARGEKTSEFLTRISRRSVPKIYHAAYARWQQNLLDTDQMALWCGRIQSRLFTGVGMPHPLETQVMRNRLYGVPLLPGSGLKGLARDWARKYSDLNENEIAVLFGRAGDDGGGDAGYLVFHDAWWIPDSASTPLAKEVVTVHHGDYYSSEGGTPATDFDSPNPSFQLAVRGSFLFAVEGAVAWADLAMEILRKGLEAEGFGGKVAAGYGYFVEDSMNIRLLEAKKKDKEKEEKNRQKQVAFEALPESEQAALLFQQFVDGLPHPLTKDRYPELVTRVNEYLKQAANWSTAEKSEIVHRIEQAYDRFGWGRPGDKAARKKKQEEKKRAALASFLGDSSR